MSGGQRRSVRRQRAEFGRQFRLRVRNNRLVRARQPRGFGPGNRRGRRLQQQRPLPARARC